MLERLSWWCRWGNAGRLTNPAITKTQKQGYELLHANIHFIYEMMDHLKTSYRSKLQDLHNIEQDIQKESQGGPRIDGVAEARGLESEQ